MSDDLNLSQERSKARRHGYLDAISAGAGARRVELLRRGVQQLEAWHRAYGAHQPDWLPPAGDVRWLEDVAAELNGTPGVPACATCEGKGALGIGEICPACNGTGKAGVAVVARPSFNEWLDGPAHTGDMTRRQLLAAHETPADIDLLLMAAYAAAGVEGTPK